LNIGNGFAVELVKAVSASTIILGLQDASLNGVDVNGQLLLLDT
jgi:hypothetical protein